MTSASWHARISCGRDTGAGFLVTDRHVLTCAHVVARSDTDEVRVSFAHGDGEAVTARVIAHGGWDGCGTARGDVAVLELDRRVDLPPAEFAAVCDAYGDPPRKLLAYGFPKNYDEGTLAEYRATADQLIAGEWVQLEAWEAHGQALVPGFSGAAVTLAGSGRVVGVVTSAARDSGIRNGRMLPAHFVARYWPPLADLIPTPGYGREQRRRLRLLIEAADRQDTLECGAERLYRDAVRGLGPPPPPSGFASLWEAAWFLMFEVPDPEAVVRFTARLADFVDDAATRGALRSWPYPRRGTRSVREPGAPSGWSPILVEIAPSGRGDDHFLVEVYACNGGHRRMVGSPRRLPAGRVRAYALERIGEAYEDLEPEARELIAFVLPRRLLNLDVAHWPRTPDDDSPLGSFAPVVVLGLERRRDFAVQHMLRKKWRRVDVQPETRLHRIGCRPLGQNPKSLTVQLRRSTGMVGFGSPPRAVHTRRLFDAALNAAVPAMLWPRAACRGGPSHDDCQGASFLDRVGEHLVGLPLRELPALIHEFREAAYASESPEPHWAHDMTLLWEDPACLPDPAGFQQLPVG